jgi:predicted methyltransferase
MKSVSFCATVLTLAVACGGSQEPAPVAPSTTTASAAPSDSGSASAPAPVAAAPAPAAEPTAEQKKKEEERKALEADRAKMLADHKAELARYTPELRAEAKTLADTAYPSGRVALQAVLKGKHREPGNPERDVYRHPLDTLGFFGLKPTQAVLEYGPGEGWYTEILAPVLAKRGKLFVTTPDPKGPADARPTFYAQRTKLFLERSPELYGKVEAVVVDGKKPDLAFDHTLDMVVVFRGLHGMVNNNVLDQWLAEFHTALKPNGVLAVEQHRAKPDAEPLAASKNGYLPEKWVIEKIEAAGFKLLAKSELNSNPKDTKDYPEGVWSLPPTLRQGETDKAKYMAIGESDRMTLKFVKVTPPAKK